MALWCRNMPLVSAPMSVEPKHVTFVLPFYMNAEFLRQQLAWWRQYPAHVRAHLSAVIVDDGSPMLAADVLRGASLPFPIRLFRIEVDRRWNWIAARNIAMHHAADGWCLLTDMDHVVPASTADAVVFGRHDAKTIYGFSRLEHTGESIQPHPNSWLMTRAMFWTVGGYDEALSGFYGSDGDWRRRCAQVAPMAILTDRLVRHEYQGDSSTTGYERKQPEDVAVGRIIAQRRSGWRPKTLSFPYHEEALEAVPC